MLCSYVYISRWSLPCLDVIFSMNEGVGGTTFQSQPSFQIEWLASIKLQKNFSGGQLAFQIHAVIADSPTRQAATVNILVLLQVAQLHLIANASM